MNEDIVDLMDWKNVERQCIDSIRAAYVNIRVNRILLNAAQTEIHELGGLTAEEEEKAMKTGTFKHDGTAV